MGHIGVLNKHDHSMNVCNDEKKERNGGQETSPHMLQITRVAGLPSHPIKTAISLYIYIYIYI